MMKTYYPHWGKHTAFNAFLEYFDKAQFDINMFNIPMGDEIPSAAVPLLPDFPPFPIPLCKKYRRRKIKKEGVREYKLNDFRAETFLLWSALFQKIHTVLLIDAEHTLMYLPRWYKSMRFFKKPPKIIAMFHQPPAIIESLINIDIVKQVDHILVVSPTQAEYFQQFLPPERITSILLGIDTHHFKPSNRKKETGKLKCLGGGVWLRDYEIIFETAKLLEKQNQMDIEFHFVAPGDIGSPDQKNIIFHENIPDEELMDLYHECHLLFLPMQDATANTFLLEGCACGLPVIANDHPSIRAYFPGPEAELVKQRDAETYAQILVRLKDKPQELAQKSSAARKRALELSWENTVKEYQKIFMSL